MPLTNVPLAGQTLGQTRDLIAGNFTSIGTSFIVDHIDYGITNTGKHNQVTFPNHTGAISFASGEIGLFNQTAAPTSRPEIWLQRGTASTGINPFPMTGFGNNATVGWTYLPSGVLMKWGQTQIGSAGVNIAFTASQGPAYSTTAGSVYIVFITVGSPYLPSNQVYINSFGGMGQGNTFTVNSTNTGGSIVFQYLMIGNS